MAGAGAAGKDDVVAKKAFVEVATMMEKLLVLIGAWTVVMRQHVPASLVVFCC